jgi:hypothetical protein
MFAEFIAYLKRYSPRSAGLREHDAQFAAAAN